MLAYLEEQNFPKPSAPPLPPGYDEKDYSQPTHFGYKMGFPEPSAPPLPPDDVPMGNNGNVEAPSLQPVVNTALSQHRRYTISKFCENMCDGVSFLISLCSIFTIVCLLIYLLNRLGATNIKL